jgi:hypothetical protein
LAGGTADACLPSLAAVVIHDERFLIRGRDIEL